jgi:hypothetical protein
MSDTVITHPSLPFNIIHRGQEVYLEYPTGATKPVGHEFLVLGSLLLKVSELGVEPEKKLDEDSLDEEVKHLVDKVIATKRVSGKKGK